MNVNVTTPSITVSAICLLLLAYTNRFGTLSKIIRDLVDECKDGPTPDLITQIALIRKQITLIKAMKVLGILSLIHCAFTILLVVLDYQPAAHIVFMVAICLFCVSLFVMLYESVYNGTSLRILLDNLEKKGR